MSRDHKSKQGNDSSVKILKLCPGKIFGYEYFHVELIKGE